MDGNSSPLAVEGLDPRIQELIRERGWTSLTPIQEKALPAILEGANTLIMAPTGEGKTEAALLPVLSEIVRTGAEPVALLYITPMKALINDLYKRIEWWAARLGLRVARKHGDTSAAERNRRLREIPHILITTPESLEIDLDWAPRFRVHYRNLRWVIVDEVHELLASKRGAQFAIQLERLREFVGRDFQVIGLSATVGDPDWTLTVLAGSSRRRKRIIDSGTRKQPDVKVVYAGEASTDPWLNAAKTVVEEIEKPSLVFVNSRYVAERMKTALEELGVDDVFVHHSSVAAKIREEAEEKLRRGELSAVVCTKTLEVGIDVGKIRKVIQVKSPGRVASLLQRIGRSGHKIGEVPRGTIVTTDYLDFVESLAVGKLAREGFVEKVAIRRIPLDVIARQIQGMLLASPGLDADTIYNIISRHPAVNLSREEYENLLDYMVELGTIRRNNGELKLGPTFYKIWRFRGDKGPKVWWSRDFSEFFSTISERDSFMVKHGDNLIGYIDSIFVYRHLRPGDTIRLAGRAWLVKRIDENLGKIEVEPTTSPAEVPLWRGEGPRRDPVVAAEIASILYTGDLGGVRVSPEDYRIIEEWREEYRKRGIPLPGENRIIYERYRDEHVFTVLLGSGASEALALAVTHEAVRKVGLNVFYRSMHAGFSVFVGSEDPFEILSSIDPDELEEIILAALERSPYLYQVIREIQVSFGKIGTVDFDDDYIIVDEARRQVIEEYLDIERAAEFLRRFQAGKIEVKAPLGGGLTPIAREILSAPAIRPWMQDLALRIARLLEGSALTVLELADILELAEKTVESKIKEMRKPEYGENRVVGFVDVDEDEWRWTLVRTLAEVATSEEFAPSFEPYRIREPLKLYVRVAPGHRPREIIVTPELVLRNYERIASALPPEIYRVKIASAYSENRRDDFSVVHYHVPAHTLRYLILNAARYLESKYEFF